MYLRKLIVLAMALLLLFAFSGCGNNGEEDLGQNNETNESEAIPDEGAESSGPVAIVNGEEIPRAAFDEKLQNMMGMYGMPEGEEDNEETAAMKEMMKEQVLQELISRTLLTQKVEDVNVQVDENTIQEEFDHIQEHYGGEEEFTQLLDEEGYTPDSFKEAIAEELAISQYLDSYVEETLGSDEMEADEEELRDLYNQHKEQMGEDPPEFEEVKDDLEDAYQQEKVQKVTGQLLENLMEESDIEILL